MAAALHHLAWYSVAGAAIAVIAGLGCMMLAWRALLADLGSPLPLRPAARILFVAQLGKYVPGAVWAMAAQVELARAYEVPRRRSASATVVAMLITLATGLLVAAVALPLSSGAAARHYWWALALAPPALIALYPPVMGWAPGPGAAPGQAPAARAPDQRLRRAPGRRLVAGRVGVLQRAFLAAGGRRDRQGRQRAADSRRGVRAGLVGRVRPHPVPRRCRAAGACLHRRAGAGHAARVSDRGRRRLPAGADDRGPGLGGSRVRARPRRPARARRAAGLRARSRAAPPLRPRTAGPRPGTAPPGRLGRPGPGTAQPPRADDGAAAQTENGTAAPAGAGTEAPARKGAAGTAGQGTAARAGNSARR